VAKKECAVHGNGPHKRGQVHFVNGPYGGAYFCARHLVSTVFVICPGCGALYTAQSRACSMCNIEFPQPNLQDVADLLGCDVDDLPVVPA
jgi:hypothetical protein